MNAAYSQSNPMARVLSLSNFRLLFIGAFVSLLGDQFALIATPWLVLQLTHDPLALGTVLALEGLPRAAIILFGGAITDHISPRRMMLLANIIRLFLTALMAVLIFTGLVQLWMMYAFGLLFGIVAGFALPAETSIAPMLLDDADLQAGNSIIMGISQLANFVGPTLAGVIIGRFANTTLGVGLAFAFDSFTFVVSAVTLQLLQVKHQTIPGQAGAPRESVLASIQAGLKYLWHDKPLLFVFTLMIVSNFLLIGPIFVGIPVLAAQRLPEGAAAFGLLMSAYAGGNLIGYIVTGALPRPSGGKLRLIMLVLFAAFGGVFGALGVLTSTWLDAGLLFLLGLGNGFVALILITWMQTRAPRDMLGRMMAMMMFAGTGLMPVSQAVAGILGKWDLTLLFVIPGALVLLTTVWAALHPGLKSVTDSIATAA